MTATSTTPVDDGPMQLPIPLLGPGEERARRRAAARSYWDHADAVDLGGPLRARSRWARVEIDAEALDGGGWRGHHHLDLPACGMGGSTKRMPLRADALASSAHAVAAHCRRVIDAGDREPRTADRAAREVLRWLGCLDLL
jgi:hypothetical protein